MTDNQKRDNARFRAVIDALSFYFQDCDAPRPDKMRMMGLACSIAAATTELVELGLYDPHDPQISGDTWLSDDLETLASFDTKFRIELSAAKQAVLHPH